MRRAYDHPVALGVEGSIRGPGAGYGKWLGVIGADDGADDAWDDTEGDAEGGGEGGFGIDFVVIGLAMPPCLSIPLNIPEMCLPGPANVAIELAFPPIVFPGSIVNIVFPVPFPAIDLTIQCATITPTNCIILSRAHRIAIRP